MWRVAYTGVSPWHQSIWRRINVGSGVATSLAAAAGWRSAVAAAAWQLAYHGWQWRRHQHRQRKRLAANGVALGIERGGRRSMAAPLIAWQLMATWPAAS